MNTHPNTPFGKFFFKIGLWHYKIDDGIEAAYEKLHDAEKLAIQDASGLIAIINANAKAAPDILFQVIENKFPAITKESVTDFLNKLNAQILHADAEIPDTFEDAVSKIQAYLSKYEGKTWGVITKAVVTIGADILMNGAKPIQIIDFVLEYVYQTFVKPKIAA